MGKKPAGAVVKEKNVALSPESAFQNFETSGHDIGVDHFSLTTYDADIPSFVGNREPAYENIAVPHISLNDAQRWNAYYYETKDKEMCLTVFLPPPTGHPAIVHFKRGKFMDFV